MTGQRGPLDGGSLDLAAVARDADLLDLLATRAPEPADDEVAGLLAALAAEVDDGLETWLRDRVPAVAAADVPVQRLPAVRAAAPAENETATRRHGLRVSTVAVVLGATLSVGGVAAAVTGDPLAAYHGIVHAVTGQGSGTPAPGPSPHAARVASLNHLLNGMEARLQHGEVAGVQGDLGRLRLLLQGIPDLTKGERTAIEARIAALEASLARESAKADARATHQKDKATTGGKHSAPARTPAPQRSGAASTHRPPAHATRTPAPRHPKAAPTPASGGAAQQAPAAPAATVAPTTAPRGNGGGSGSGKATGGGAATTPTGSQRTKAAGH